MTVNEVKKTLEQEIERKEKMIASGHKNSTRFSEQNENATKMLEIISKWCQRRPSPFAYLTPEENRIIGLYHIDLTI